MQTVTLEVENGDVSAAIRRILGQLLSLDDIDALMVPGRLPNAAAIMPLLISTSDQLEMAEPLAPAFALNAAKQVCRLTRTPSNQRIAAVLRPCEIRAFVELVKLKQGLREQVIIIGIDCLGAYTNATYDALARKGDDDAIRQFYREQLSGASQTTDGASLAKACRACEHCLPTGADLAVCLWGIDTRREVMLQAQTEPGQEILAQLALTTAALPAERTAAIKAVVAERTQFRDQMFADTAAATADMEKLGFYFSQCVNCYNCRTACPVCYCRQCVFETNLFSLARSVIKEGLGISTFLRMVLAEDTQLAAVSFDPPLYLDLHLAWKADGYLSRANRAFLDFLLERVATR